MRPLHRFVSGGPRRLLAAYRATGADLPFGDPLGAHGVAMEGYFWRVTHPITGRVVIALIGVNRDCAGRHWGTLGLAAHPEPRLRAVAASEAYAAWPGLGAGSGSAFVADENGVRVNLGHDAQLEFTIRDPVRWPRRAFGGSSLFHVVPALNQYWHPWLLGGTVFGSARIGDQVWDLDGATVYAEKNWGREGFPESWWWGQAQGFEQPGVCVAFAGGQVTAGPFRAEITALVVRLPDGEVIRLGNPGTSPVQTRTTDTTWDLHGRSLSGWQIDVSGHAPLGDAHVLPVPLPSQRRNTAGDLEHLGATMTVSVRRHRRLIWEGRSDRAALEHGGLDRAEAELRRRGIPPGATHAPPEL